MLIFSEETDWRHSPNNTEYVEMPTWGGGKRDYKKGGRGKEEGEEGRQMIGGSSKSYLELPKKKIQDIQISKKTILCC